MHPLAMPSPIPLTAHVRVYGRDSSPAADIFSFGIMMLEVKSGVSLPGHGEAWQALRGLTASSDLPLSVPTNTSDPRLVAVALP